MRRAIAQYDVNVACLTLSKNQSPMCRSRSTRWTPRARQASVAMGWGAVQRASSTASYRRVHTSATIVTPTSLLLRPTNLPPDGVLLLHAITGLDQAADGRPRLAAHTLWLARFLKFIATEIFPGANLRRLKWRTVGEDGVSRRTAASRCSRIVVTLDLWAEALQEHKKRGYRDPVRKSVYERYMKYLTCAVPGRLHRLFQPVALKRQ